MARGIRPTTAGWAYPGTGSLIDWLHTGHSFVDFGHLGSELRGSFIGMA